MRWLRALLGLPPKTGEKVDLNLPPGIRGSFKVAPAPKVRLYGPQGLWLEYSDGERYEDVPSVYIGDDPDDGCATYEVIPPRAPDEDLPINMGIGVMPPMTAVKFPFKGPPNWPYEDDTITPV